MIQKWIQTGSSWGWEFCLIHSLSPWPEAAQYIASYRQYWIQNCHGLWDTLPNPWSLFIPNSMVGTNLRDQCCYQSLKTILTLRSFCGQCVIGPVVWFWRMASQHLRWAKDPCLQRQVLGELRLHQMTPSNSSFLENYPLHTSTWSSRVWIVAHHVMAWLWLDKPATVSFVLFVVCSEILEWKETISVF